ncbi:MAG: AAA family ATPase [Acidobacteriaceae bacterium]|nr:AAA family ATPase [Acidobacteriaceae bacterium]
MSRSNQGFLNVIVLTVGTDIYTTDSLMRVAKSRAWMVETFHSEEYLSAHKRPSFGPQLQDADRCVAFLDFERSPEAAAETARFLTESYGNKVLVVAVVRTQLPALIVSAMRSGCNELLTEPIQLPALESIFDQIDRLSAGEYLPQAQEGTVLAIVGAKGGVGSTALAVHLATFLAKRSGKRTLLIDNHTYGGHVAVYLGIDSSNYFEEAVRNLSRMDSELLKRFVVQHSSGLEVMTSPDVFDAARMMEPEAVRRAFEFLRTEYAYIVVDCSRDERAINRPVFAVAKTIYPVTTPDVAAARDLSRFIDELAVMDDWADKTRIILNRSNSPLAIPSEQIEHATRQRIAVRVPNGYQELTRAANLGEPLDPNSHSDSAVALSRWADEVAGTVSRKPKSAKEGKVLSALRHPFTPHSSFGL